jgi:hypothetical protein
MPALTRRQGNFIRKAANDVDSLENVIRKWLRAAGKPANAGFTDIWRKLFPVQTGVRMVADSRL